MARFVMRVFEALDQTGIRYCVLRDGEQLEVQTTPGEVDLLIAAGDFKRTVGALAAVGFRKVKRWGYSPHYFFAGFDDSADAWIKLDVVTDIRYGRPVPVIFTSLAEACLARRKRYGGLYVPSAEDELVTLLLHCILDKGRFEPHRWSRVRALQAAVQDTLYLASLVRRHMPDGIEWADLEAMIDAEDGKALLALRPSLEAALRRRTAWRSFFIEYSSRMLRKLNRLTDRLQPASERTALRAILGN